MISFLHYLKEADRLRHLSHAEDRVIESGRSGFRQAFSTLHGLHKFLKGKETGMMDVSEAPAAYKDISSVMSNQTDLVKPVVELTPIMCMKG